MTEVRTRFAPSPTGYMHIGGMRTALFNWLWSRHCGGKFILRIDDTDQQRNIEAALNPILDAFRWLQMEWDEGPEVGGPHGPYFQSQRGPLYKQAAETLLASGLAYRDFDTPEQIKADREEAEKAGRNYITIRRSLDLTESQREQYVAEGRPFVVRFLVPREQKVVIDDLVRGRVEWDCGLMPDPVILRGDGSPLYNFATVIDDSAMRITHVIRAEEHLSNTPVQVVIHQALGNTLPQFAHIPYVAAPGSKEKLSKRKLDKYRNNPQFKKMFEAGDRIFPQIGLGATGGLDPVMVEYYQRIGYLPHAVFNALARIGWSLDDKTEIMTRETIVSSFTLDRVIKSPAGFDPDKLNSFQQHWMGQLSLEDKVAGCRPYLQAADMDQRSTGIDLGRVITAVGDRLKLFSDILEYPEYFTADDAFAYDEKDFDKRVRKAPDSIGHLAAFRDILARVEPFDAPTLDAALHEFVQSRAIKMGDIIHALRIAVTGKAVGPGMFDCLSLLGRERCLARIDRTLRLAEFDSKPAGATPQQRP